MLLILSTHSGVITALVCVCLAAVDVDHYCIQYGFAGERFMRGIDSKSKQTVYNIMILSSPFCEGTSRLLSFRLRQLSAVDISVS